MVGEPLSGSDARLLRAFANYVGSVRRTEQLQQEAAAARAAEAGDRVRSALLAAVGHDLRTPLATIKASAASLRDESVALPATDRRELLEGIEVAADRLAGLVGNLLDLSGLASGALLPDLANWDVAGVVEAAVARREDAERVRVELPAELPQVRIDAARTGRILRPRSGQCRDPRRAPAGAVAASCLGGRLELRVVDRGSGMDDARKRSSFEPVQRLGDSPQGIGLGLGLAVARGLAEIQGGSLEPEDTPGGGLTLVLSLPLAGRCTRMTTVSLLPWPPSTTTITRTTMTTPRPRPRPRA